MWSGAELRDGVEFAVHERRFDSGGGLIDEIKGLTTIRIGQTGRAFVVDGRGYSIQWRTPDAQWQANRGRFAVIVGSFRSAAPR